MSEVLPSETALKSRSASLHKWGNHAINLGIGAVFIGGCARLYSAMPTASAKLAAFGTAQIMTTSLLNFFVFGVPVVYAARFIAGWSKFGLSKPMQKGIGLTLGITVGSLFGVNATHITAKQVMHDMQPPVARPAPVPTPAANLCDYCVSQ